MNDAIAALVRRHDPDRFLSALFAPPEHRPTLLILYALNHELARAREVASQPVLALMRLQWWREVIEGTEKRHPVASPLSQAIRAGKLQAAALLPLVEARETEAYGELATLGEWRGWLMAGAGGLAVAAASVLEAPDSEAARSFGAGYGVSGLLRSTGVLAAQGTCLLPHDLLARHDLSPEGFVADPGSTAARAVLACVIQEGQLLLTGASGLVMPRAAIASVLPAVLARRDLAAFPDVAIPRRLGDRLAVFRAAITGRI